MLDQFFGHENEEGDHENAPFLGSWLKQKARLDWGGLNETVRFAAKIQVHYACILLLDARPDPPGIPAPRVSYSVVLPPPMFTSGDVYPST
jgi:hypothetical protein